MRCHLRSLEAILLLCIGLTLALTLVLLPHMPYKPSIPGLDVDFDMDDYDVYLTTLQKDQPVFKSKEPSSPVHASFMRLFQVPMRLISSWNHDVSMLGMLASPTLALLLFIVMCCSLAAELRLRVLRIPSPPRPVLMAALEHRLPLSSISSKTNPSVQNNVDIPSSSIRSTSSSTPNGLPSKNKHVKVPSPPYLDLSEPTPEALQLSQSLSRCGTESCTKSTSSIVQAFFNSASSPTPSVLMGLLAPTFAAVALVFLLPHPLSVSATPPALPSTFLNNSLSSLPNTTIYVPSNSTSPPPTPPSPIVPNHSSTTTSSSSGLDPRPPTADLPPLSWRSIYNDKTPASCSVTAVSAKLELAPDWPLLLGVRATALVVCACALAMAMQLLFGSSSEATRLARLDITSFSSTSSQNNLPGQLPRQDISPNLLLLATPSSLFATGYRQTSFFLLSILRSPFALTFVSLSLLTYWLPCTLPGPITFSHSPIPLTTPSPLALPFALLLSGFICSLVSSQIFGPFRASFPMSEGITVTLLSSVALTLFTQHFIRYAYALGFLASLSLKRRAIIFLSSPHLVPLTHSISTTITEISQALLSPSLLSHLSLILNSISTLMSPPSLLHHLTPFAPLRDPVIAASLALPCTALLLFYIANSRLGGIPRFSSLPSSSVCITSSPTSLSTPPAFTPSSSSTSNALSSSTTSISSSPSLVEPPSSPSSPTHPSSRSPPSSTLLRLVLFGVLFVLWPGVYALVGREPFAWLLDFLTTRGDLSPLTALVDTVISRAPIVYDEVTPPIALRMLTIEVPRAINALAYHAYEKQTTALSALLPFVLSHVSQITHTLYSSSGLASVIKGSSFEAARIHACKHISSLTTVMTTYVSSRLFPVYHSITSASINGITLLGSTISHYIPSFSTASSQCFAATSSFLSSTSSFLLPPLHTLYTSIRSFAPELTDSLITTYSPHLTNTINLGHTALLKVYRGLRLAMKSFTGKIRPELEGIRPSRERLLLLFAIACPPRIILFLYCLIVLVLGILIILPFSARPSRTPSNTPPSPSSPSCHTSPFTLLSRLVYLPFYPLSLPFRLLPRPRLPSIPLIVLRKYYHFLATLIMLPPLLLDPAFLSLALSAALCILILIEVIRIHRIPPIGAPIHRFMSAFVDSRDAGPLFLTHIYLLLGCAIPSWLSLTLTPALASFTTSPSSSLLSRLVAHYTADPTFTSTSSTSQSSISRLSISSYLLDPTNPFHCPLPAAFAESAMLSVVQFPHIAFAAAIPALTGLLVLGIGDSAASLFGTYLSHTRKRDEQVDEENEDAVQGHSKDRSVIHNGIEMSNGEVANMTNSSNHREEHSEPLSTNHCSSPLSSTNASSSTSSSSSSTSSSSSHSRGSVQRPSGCLRWSRDKLSTRWPGSRKTIGGTLAAILSMILFAAFVYFLCNAVAWAVRSAAPLPPPSPNVNASTSSSTEGVDQLEGDDLGGDIEENDIRELQLQAPRRGTMSLPIKPNPSSLSSSSSSSSNSKTVGGLPLSPKRIARSLPQLGWKDMLLGLGIASLCVAMLEAWTEHIDNLFLPLVFFALVAVLVPSVPHLSLIPLANMFG